MHIAIVTAGGAGMFCGSCMHDNSWARALMAAGHEVSLVPTYTPVRLDEPSAVNQRVFFGGVNVYLDSKSRLWRRVPKALKSWLDRPSLLNLVTRLATRNDASKLGDLTLGMLEGINGPNRQAVDELTTFLAKELKPDAIIFSNALLSGAVGPLLAEFAGPIFVTLQGDDVFLDGLTPTYKEQAIAAVSRNAVGFTGYFSHTRFYRDYMANYLRLDPGRFELIPLSIDPAGHTGKPSANADRPPTIGYFARIAPEKGLHNLVDAVEKVREMHPAVRLRVGGYLGAQHAKYWRRIRDRVSSWGNGFEYIGSPETLAEKVEFLTGCDVFSVPTEFLEPKGLYILEALANGVSVVQPERGSFPELIESTGGGWIGPMESLPAIFADAIAQPAERQRRAERGQAAVREKHSPAALATATARALELNWPGSNQGDPKGAPAPRSPLSISH